MKNREIKGLVERALSETRQMDAALRMYDKHYQNLVGIVMQLGFDVPDLTGDFNNMSAKKLELSSAALPVLVQLRRWQSLL